MKALAALSGFLLFDSDLQPGLEKLLPFRPFQGSSAHSRGFVELPGLERL